MAHHLSHILQHPVLATVLIMALMIPLWKLTPSLPSRFNPIPLCNLAAAAIILAYLAVIAWYAHGPFFADHSEPLTICVAWAWYHGQPIYHAADAAARYTLAYGPLLYLIEGAWLQLAPSLAWAKLPCVLASAASVSIVALTAARHQGSRRALPVTALFCLILLQFHDPTAFWTRPDPFLLLAVAFAALAAETFPAPSGILAVGLALGLAPLLKIFGFIYFLPLVPLIWRRWGFQSLLLIGLLSVAIFAIPFTLLPRISFGNHLYWLLMARRQGFDIPMIHLNIEFATFYLLLLAVLTLWAKLPISRPEWACLLISTAAAVFFGSKAGGAWYYLMPLIPVYFMLATRPAGAPLPAFATPCLASFVLASLAIALFGGVILAKTVSPQRDAPQAQRDLLAIIHDLRGQSLAMGSGGFLPGDPATTRIYLRPLLLFAGNPLGVDPTALAERAIKCIGLSRFSLAARAIDRETNRAWKD